MDNTIARFAGKVSFVTGAAAGIGRAAALAFAREQPSWWSPTFQNRASRKRPV
jgi:hypothetical protein